MEEINILLKDPKMDGLLLRNITKLEWDDDGQFLSFMDDDIAVQVPYCAIYRITRVIKDESEC